jgi:hypothetical protein
MCVHWIQLSMITVMWSVDDDIGLIVWLPCKVNIVSVRTMMVYGGAEEYLSSL